MTRTRCVTAALSTLLGRIDIDLVGAATSASTAKTLLQEHRPSLLVLDVDLPEGRDEALRLIAAGRIERSDLTVIVLSGTDDRGIIEAAIDRGAAAYVLKSTDTDAIATAIRQVFEPSVYLARPKERAHAATTETPEVLRKLTRRELEILQLVSGGRSNRQVAQILWVADQTVKFHLANVYRKLGVRNRFEAARWARRTGSSTWSSTPARRSRPPSLRGRTATAQTGARPLRTRRRDRAA